MFRKLSLVLLIAFLLLALSACDQFGGTKVPANWPTPDIPLPKGAVELSIVNELTGNNGGDPEKAVGPRVQG